MFVTVSLHIAKFLVTLCLFTGELPTAATVFIGEFFLTVIFVHRPICPRRFLRSPAYFSKF